MNIDTSELKNQHQQGRDSAVDKWNDIDENDKIDILEAICSIIIKSEKAGTTHRGLLNDLGVYPGGMFVLDLMDIHNALVTEYQK